MKNDKISRIDFIKKMSVYALSLTGMTVLFKSLMKPACAATGTCQECDFSFRIIDQETGYLTCFLIASNKQLSLKDRKDYYTASFYRTESSCPAKIKYKLPGFVPRTDAPFPPVFSGLTPYGILGRKVTPGIKHPNDGVYTCTRCGYAAFFIYTSGFVAKRLLCGKCSNLMNV